MKKVILAVLLIAVVCITSGAYALFSDNADISDSTPAKLDSAKDIDLNLNDLKEINSNSHNSVSDSNNILQSNDQGKSNNLNNLESFVENIEDAYGHSLNEPFVVNADDSINDNDLTDRYVQCVICGGFIPLGSVENPLPSNVKTCSHPSGSFDLNDLEKQSYSRDEVCKLAQGSIAPKTQETKLIGDNPRTLEELKIIIDNAEEGSTLVLDSDYIANSTPTSIVIDKYLTVDGGKHVLAGEKIASIDANFEKVSFKNTGFYEIQLKDSVNSPDEDVFYSDGDVSFVSEDFATQNDGNSIIVSS